MWRAGVFFLGLVLPTYSLGATTSKKHDLNAIRAEVSQVLLKHLTEIYGAEKVKHDVEFTLTNLDSRLALPQCEQALKLGIQESSYGSRNLSVRVQCPSGSRWAVIVPARLDIYDTVAISTQSLNRGQRIRAGDVSFKRTNTSNIARHYLNSLDALIGKELKRSLAAGSVIKQQDIQEPKLIKRGETVLVLAYIGQLTVSSEGKAMNDGRFGQQIRIHNLKSDRIVDARVTGPGEAEVNIR